MFSIKSLLAGSIACVSLAACSGLSQSSPATSRAMPQSRAEGKSEALFPAGTPVVYVADNSSCVYIYTQSGKNQKPIGKLTSGLNGPGGLAVDADGNVYVANFSGGTVAVFKQGQKTPYKTLTGGTGNLLGVAVDSGGNVYSGDFSSGTITVWASGSTTPTSRLATGFPRAAYVAVDAAGDAFVSDFEANEVAEFPAGSTTPVVVRTDQAGAAGLAVDGSQNLVVVNDDVGINVYAPPYTSKNPIAQVKFTDNVFAVALNSADSSLWYADRTTKVATQTTYPGLKKLESTKTKVMSVYLNGIALYPAAPL